MPRSPGLRTQYHVDEAASRGQERTLAVNVGDWGGAEIRPTRVFLWLGPRGRGMERLLSTGREPRLLRVARRRRHLDLGRVSLSFLGNPLLTVALLVVNVLRRPAGQADPGPGDRGVSHP